jgi:hypothetical protein
MSARLLDDFERFKRELPPDAAEYIRETYGVNLTARYLGYQLPHPSGKGSGQLSLNLEQLEADRAAGLAFVILKTVIGEDAAGERSMGAWAVHETRMRIEQRPSREGRAGWTVTWKGRGWDRSFEEYLALVRAGRDVTRAGEMLVVPSAKLHLPRLDESFCDREYRHTIGGIADAWGSAPLPIEKDFSPTLAGDSLAGERAQILRWLREVPGRMRDAVAVPVRLALKLMNARFDDAFQLEMIEAASAADTLVCFNRLWDPDAEVAYGGYDLSERNLRVLAARPRHREGPAYAGTGNICSGRLLLEYARLGCEAVQLHTFFQLPLRAYPAVAGSRTQRALHALLFDPADGLVAGMLQLETDGLLERRGGELHFLDVTTMRGATNPA